MKHLLHLVVENEGANWLLIFNPTTATLVHSQPLAIDALNTFLQADIDALLASLPPLTFDRPEPLGTSSMLIMGRDDQERVLFACAAAATSWDGTENTDGYGYWRSVRYRFRIVEVTSTGVIPVVEVNRSSLLKEAASMSGNLLDCFDGQAFFFCQPAVADNSTQEQVITLSKDGPGADSIWGGFTFQTNAFFNTATDLLVAISEQVS